MIIGIIQVRNYAMVVSLSLDSLNTIEFHLESGSTYPLGTVRGKWNPILSETPLTPYILHVKFLPIISLSN